MNILGAQAHVQAIACRKKPKAPMTEIDSLRFSALDVGRIIRIGEAELQVMIETDPCPRMDEQHQGLTAALTPDWRAGVCCRVLSGGQIQVYDCVAWQI